VSLTDLRVLAEGLDWSVCFFECNTHGANSPPHFYICIPIEGKVLLCMVTSQVEAREAFYEKNHTHAGVVITNETELTFLSRASLIDCNQPLYGTPEELNSYVRRWRRIVVPGIIPEDVKRSILLALSSSNMVSARIKRITSPMLRVALGVAD
jgi:hypothetical protein